MVRSPATSAFVPFAASFESATSLRFISSKWSSKPYSFNFILLAVKVGANKISVPASTYRFCRSINTSEFSRIHCSGHTPTGIPAFCKFVPVAPSSSTGPFFTSSLNASLVIAASSFPFHVIFILCNLQSFLSSSGFPSYHFSKESYRLRQHILHHIIRLPVRVSPHAPALKIHSVSYLLRFLSPCTYSHCGNNGFLPSKASHP